MVFAIILVTLFFRGKGKNERRMLRPLGGEECFAEEFAEQPPLQNRYSSVIYRGNERITGKENLAEDPEILHDRLRKVFYEKFESPQYIAWSNLPGIPKGFQNFPQEGEIRELRSQLARKSVPPDGTKVIIVPLFPDLRITVDGLLVEPEWEEGAAKVIIGKDGSQVVLYLVSDGSDLFLGCDAIDEKTEEGFDQFRFYIHPTTSYLIENERIHVSWRRASAIRQTRLKWRKAPPVAENERWKKYDICDWNIYELCSGTHSFKGHKKYEASINLRESGLHLMIPFSAFVEVESDPIYEGKKFKKRVIIGELGNQHKPVWFMIRKIPAEALK